MSITTPTEESVRRAMAIQLILAKELGVLKNENTLQGSFVVEELTDLVEEAVLQEFDRIDQRGGVLGAMETQYQRGQIQEESLHYEHLKHSGDLPIVGINTLKIRRPLLRIGDLLRWDCAAQAEEKTPRSNRSRISSSPPLNRGRV